MRLMKTVQWNVIFDFGGVLLRWKPQEIIDGFYPDDPSRQALRRLVFQHPDWSEMDAGLLGEEEATRRFAARMGRPQEEMRAFMEYVKNSLIPVEESFALAHALAKRGIPLYGLSNMPAFMFSELRRRYTHWEIFRGIVISGEVRLVKPNPAIFAHISQVYDLEPSNSVFIDDLLPNIEAASGLGFRVIQFSDPQQCARDLESLLLTRSAGRDS